MVSAGYLRVEFLWPHDGSPAFAEIRTETQVKVNDHENQ